MVNHPNKMMAEIGPEFNEACLEYTKAAMKIVKSLGRIAGLSKEAAHEIATSKEMADMLALGLYNLTNQTVAVLNKYKHNIE